MNTNSKEYKVKEFALTLTNCLICETDLPKEKIRIFVAALAQDLYELANGETESGLLPTEVEDFVNETQFKVF